MKWTEIKINTNTSGIDVLTGIFLDLGINGFVVSDKNDFNEFLEGTELYWDYVDESLMHLKDQEETILTIYLPENIQGADTLKELKSQLNLLKEQTNEFGSLKINLLGIKEEDWENNWKQYFKPFKVGNKFVIKPSWEEYNEKTDRMVLEIDPASSFGTGTHDTTQLCISALENSVKKGAKLLDMGCGSGILAIAASMLGACDITIIDIDENAVKIANENAEKNNISFKSLCGNVCSDEILLNKIEKNQDVIVANIVADVIIAMADIFTKKLKKGGILITSGIISQRSNEVYTSLINTGFKINETKTQGDWVCFVCEF